MYYIQTITENKIIINKSIFIAQLYPISDKEDINACLDATKLQYPKATHYCYGAIWGNNAEHAQYDDNGEPNRTAGVPILEILKQRELTDVLCVVTRYFGGIKLGAGGLVRAYRNSTLEVINSTVLYEKQVYLGFNIVFSYSLINQIENICSSNNGYIKNKKFDSNANYDVYFPNSNLTFFDEIKHLLQITVIDNDIIWVPIKK